MDPILPETPSPILRSGVPTTTTAATAAPVPAVAAILSTSLSAPAPAAPASVITPLTLAQAASIPIKTTQGAPPDVQPATATRHPTSRSTNPSQASSPSSQASSLSSHQPSKRKEILSAPSDPPKAKEAKLSQARTSRAESSRSRGTRAGHTFSAEETSWIVTQLQDPEVYLRHHGNRDNTVRQAPKIRVYERIATVFNNRFPNTRIDSMQIKNKISKMKAQFKLADAK
ncbi:hypothetical protein BC939DRAFT_525885 [Gamsiella multidivaricata]|uniref:uncharacterized protein n=1 Tax=Gamsiella multidivaricata TaxID=101098 RepID=UPI0022212590|nr:uncharacterized protein BC939DRAFT_525885 [Gamsiella multidivaricata]KAI7829712.1 hypothetical protein BC939DRAFT_525885 [Gamsiella multidivaricata]